MNNFEQYLIKVLMETTREDPTGTDPYSSGLLGRGGVGGVDRASKSQKQAHKDRVTQYYKKVLNDPYASKDRKKEAQNYFDKGPRWREHDPI